MGRDELEIVYSVVMSKNSVYLAKCSPPPTNTHI